MRTREEHLAFCRRRAFEYCDRGDLRNAIASMTSDWRKHPEMKPMENGHYWLAMQLVIARDEPGVRRWIDGFT